jgi:hypothetical protein
MYRNVRTNDNRLGLTNHCSGFTTLVTFNDIKDSHLSFKLAAVPQLSLDMS